MQQSMLSTWTWRYERQQLSRRVYTYWQLQRPSKQQMLRWNNAATQPQQCKEFQTFFQFQWQTQCTTEVGKSKSWSRSFAVVWFVNACNKQGKYSKSKFIFLLLKVLSLKWAQRIFYSKQLEMLLIPNALCWSSRKCNCACALPAEVQLRLRIARRSWQKLFAGKNFVKILVTAQTQLRS